jgi:sugar phosphate isomerase/epimerase
MFYRTTELVNQIFDELGDKITALHAKDLSMSAVRQNESGYLSVVHVDEAVPGARETVHHFDSGLMDYATILRRLDELEHDVTMYVEHFSYEDTISGQQYIRHVARETGVTIH